jgi:hypothetical protein
VRRLAEAAGLRQIQTRVHRPAFRITITGTP